MPENPFRNLTALLTILVLTGALFPALAEEKIEREGPRPPHPTDRGRFEGTWARVEPGQRQGVQLRRAEDGTWDIRLFWQLVGKVRIDTGWEERHEYEFRGHPGFIELDVRESESTEDRLVVSYRREAEGERNAHMVETGDVEIYRSGVDGRGLVWVQERLVREMLVGDALYPDEQKQTSVRKKVWLFHKQSERIIPWDDVYW